MAERFTFVLVTYGKFVYWIDNVKMILEKGDVLLIPHALSGYGKPVPTLFHEKFVIEFERTELLPSSPPVPVDRCLLVKIGQYDFVLERMETLFSQWQLREPYFETMAVALFLEALVVCLRESDRGPLTSEKIKKVEAMKRYIQNHYKEKITKEDIGDFLGISPNYAATLFKTITGQTFSAYIHLQRVKTARQLLLTSELTLNDISEFVGYHDLSYFHKTFKKLTGQTPASYKNAMQ